MWRLNRSLNFFAAQLGYLTLSVVLTGLGFFVEQVPFAIAYIPLAIATCLGRRTQTFWLISGHFFWVAVISGWGLHQLGYNPVLIIPAVLGPLMFMSLGMTWMGIGLSSGFLCLIPFFPANPLLVSGAVFPSFGLWGIATLLLIVIGVEALRVPLARLCILVSVLIAGQIPSVLAWNEQPQNVGQTKQYVEIDISSHKAITRSGHWAQITTLIEDGSTVIFGENVFDHTDMSMIVQK